VGKCAEMFDNGERVWVESISITSQFREEKNNTMEEEEK
jgi:hypothetical protein